MLGVDKDAWLPELATQKFRSGAAESKPHAVRDGAKTPGKVAIYSTCYINYNEPGIGHDLLKVLDHNEIPTCWSKRKMLRHAQAGAGRPGLGQRSPRRPTSRCW
jgi:hypothetical protein